MSDAVQRPAAARGVGFEPGLADQIIDDAAGGALPVLEFTLTRLWQAQHRKTLTFAGYHAMGGVRGALDRFAEQQAAQLGDTAAELLDRVLLRLVRVPVGSPELATRQRILEVTDSCCRMAGSAAPGCRPPGQSRTSTLPMASRTPSSPTKP